MPSILLLLPLLASLPAAAADELPMPPPPAGMRELGPDDKRLLLGTAEEEAGAADELEGEEVELESAELEQMRALEEAELDPDAQTRAQVLQSLQRLGLANPLRQRILEALEEPALRAAVDGEVPRVKDLARFDVGLVQDRYDIPVEMQPLVAQYIRFFQGPGRRWFRKWMARAGRYIPLMQPILEAQGLPRDTVYLAMIESGFATNAYSWAHAAGPWQFIASTGKHYGLKQDFWVDERRDPVKSTEAAARYLKDLHGELGHWYLAWAGYNTGSGRVRRLMRRLETRDFWELSEGPGLAQETRHYVPKLIACALLAKNPTAFGFRHEEFAPDEPFTFDEVRLSDATDLDVVARAAGVSVKAVRELNPELKRWCTPPASARNPYVLRLPRGTGARFAENLARIPAHERLTFRVHHVKRGDTLSHIARAHGSAPEAILQLNRLKSPRALRLGSSLIIPVPSARAVRAGEAERVLERRVAQARRAGVPAVRPDEEVPAGARPPSASALVEEQAGTVIARRAASPARATPRGTVHPLAAGETLWGVAQRYGVTVADLKRWNKIGNHRALRAGQRLTVSAP